MFELFTLSGTLDVWNCKADFEACERHRVSCEGRPVAPNLLPNGRLLNVRLPKK